MVPASSSTKPPSCTQLSGDCQDSPTRLLPPTCSAYSTRLTAHTWRPRPGDRRVLPGYFQGYVTDKRLT